jgi:hypothetical protein
MNLIPTFIALSTLASAAGAYWDGNYFLATFLASAALFVFVIGRVQHDMDKMQERLDEALDRISDEIKELKDRISQYGL